MLDRRLRADSSLVCDRRHWCGTFDGRIQLLEYVPKILAGPAFSRKEE
jgi:hypothetical protein